MNTQNLNNLIDPDTADAFAKAFKNNGNDIYETLIGNNQDSFDNQKLEKEKKPMSAKKIFEIREEVERLKNENKSNRLIRRHIKRKYNITEY